MRRSARASAAAGGAGLALLAGALVAPGASASTPGCELRQLRLPQESLWGTVMDIEQVHGQTVYYGSYDEPTADGGYAQRSLVWRGLDAEPVDVGPGLVHDTAFDLTASGLVNGISVDAAGRQRPWVRDLTTGVLHWVPTATGPDARGVLPFRLNEAGAMAGVGARGRGSARAEDALAWDHFSQAPRALPALGRGAVAFGLDDAGNRSGYVAHEHLKGEGRWTVFRPTVWYADGTVRHAAMAGLDAVPRTLDGAGRMAGGTWWGDDPAAGHLEAAFWPSVDRIVGLGVLPGGSWSDALGMDGDTVVGLADRGDPSSPWGGVLHNFLWSGQQDAVRVLPSLHGVATGSTDWHEWHSTHAAHAVHSELDQVGAGTHAGFAADGTPVGAPTVFLNASQCGVEVATTHDPFGQQDLTQARTTAERRGRR